MSTDTQRYFDIRIPVITLRVILISLTVIFISFTALLPFSFLSFNYLYNRLIPNPNLTLTSSDFILNYDFPSLPPFIVISTYAGTIYGNQPKKDLDQSDLFNDFSFDLNYDLNFQFDGFCSESSKANYETVMYKISIVSSELLDELKPYDKTQNNRKWPITHKIHPFENPQILISSLNTILLDCSNQDAIEALTVSSITPPFLNWFIPPLIKDWKLSSSKPKFNIDAFKDIRLNDYIDETNHNYFNNSDFNIVIEFNKKGIIIDPSTSQLTINTSWKGLRHYLYHYRTLSYIIGVLSLWIISSVIVVVTIGGLVIWREVQNGDIQEIKTFDEIHNHDNASNDPPIVIHGDYTSGFQGTDPNHGIEFRINVDETHERRE